MQTLDSMTGIKHQNNSRRNYYIDIIALLPFLALLFTGAILLVYHVGKTPELETLGIDGRMWLLFHKIASVIAVPLILLHLILHINWLKNLFTFKLKNKNKGKNITLFVLFLLCLVTSFLSWVIFKDSVTGDGLRGIHNKFGILLIVFFTLHIISYIRWLINMTRKIFQ